MPPRREPPEIPAAFRPVVRAFAGEPGIDVGSMFSADNVVLKAGGKIFAMWARGALVVKLPKARVDELCAAGATRFDPGHGRIMKEWVVVADARSRWVALAREAHGYVTGLAKKRR